MGAMLASPCERCGGAVMAQPFTRAYDPRQTAKCLMCGDDPLNPARAPTLAEQNTRRTGGTYYPGHAHKVTA